MEVAVRLRPNGVHRHEAPRLQGSYQALQVFRRGVTRGMRDFELDADICRPPIDGEAAPAAQVALP
jgi:hypothetical protein